MWRGRCPSEVLLAGLFTGPRSAIGRRNLLSSGAIPSRRTVVLLRVARPGGRLFGRILPPISSRVFAYLFL